MKTFSQTNQQSACQTLESLRETIIEKSAGLKAVLRDQSRNAAEISHQLVYLKFYVTSSFRVEKELMLSQRHSAAAGLSAQQESIRKELCRLVDHFSGERVAMPLIAGVIERLLAELQQYMSRHDCAMFAPPTEQRRQPATTRERFVGLNRSFFAGGNYCTA